jgi:thioredoxin-dependent peroxiredoxin
MMLGWLFADPLPVGAVAPDFTLADEAGQAVSLSALRGKNVVLVFYPGDDTPGCTRQLCDLRDNWESLKAKNVQVFGVNPQNAVSHSGFREKQKLPFPLLVDKGRKVAEMYHANGLFVKRTVYLIGADGRIRLSRRGAPSPAAVMAAI